MFGNDEDFEEFKKRFSKKKDENSGMSVAFGIPEEFKEFLVKNPDLSKEVGKLLCYIAHFNVMIPQLENAIKEIRNMLVEPLFFEKFLVNPSLANKDELIRFLMAIQEAKDPIILKGMSDSERDEIKKEFGDRVNIQDINLGPTKPKGDDIIWKKDNKNKSDSNLN